MKEILEQHLKTKIIPFWVKLADYEQGGFFGHVTANHVIEKNADKGLVQQSRFLWTFSALGNCYHDQKYLELASHAYLFLKKCFYDHQSRGFMWLSDSNGKILDTRLATYGQAFAIYGLSEYYILTGEPEAARLALETFAKIEEIAFDKKLFGYHEEFDNKWNMLNSALLSDGIEGVVFTTNTLIHLLEAYTNLYLATKNELVKEAILKIIQIINDRLYDKDHRSLKMYLNDKYESLSTVRHYGHEIELSWLLDETMEILNLDNVDWHGLSSNLAKAAVADGWNGRYLCSLSGDAGQSHIWWVSSEAMVGIYNLYKKSNDSRYLDYWHKLFQSIAEDLVDPDPEGEWFWSKEIANGSKINRGMGELWKTPYHNVRAILRLLERT